MIVVSMTSWTKRINNVLDVVKSVMSNSLQPDRLYLNLSKTEFEGIELPKSLIDYFDSDDRLILNWVEGENTTTMQKVFPILKYLNDDDIIINIDDDMNIPSNFIEKRIDEYKKFGMAISGSNNPRFHHKVYYGGEMDFWICCGASCFPKKYLNGWNKIITDEIIRTYNDDFTYTMISWINGYRFKPCLEISTHSGISQVKLTKFNDNDGMGRTRSYTRDSVVIEMYDKRCLELFGKSVKDCFGVNEN